MVAVHLKHNWVLGCYGLLTLASFAFPPKLQAGTFLLQATGAASCVSYCLLANTPSKLKKRESELLNLQATTEQDALVKAEELEQRVIQAQRYLDEQYQQKLQLLEQQRELALQDLEQAKAFLESEYKQKTELLESEKQVYLGTINQLQQRLVEMDAVKLPIANSRINMLAIQLIQLCLEYKIRLDFHDAHDTPGIDYIWLKPKDRGEFRLKKLEDLASEIARELNLISPPEFSNTPDGVIQILIRLEATKTKTVKDKKGKLIEVAEPDFDWFREFVIKSHHYLICGDTGAGKSTFINNVICYVKQILQQETGEDAEVVIIDPKFPDTPWEVDGRRVIPQFIGYQPFRNPDTGELIRDENGQAYPTAYEGIEAMVKDIDERLNQAGYETLNGLPLSARKPTIYIVDEAPTLIDNADLVDIEDYEDTELEIGSKKDVVRVLLKSVRVGRSTKVKVVLIGQATKCTDYGFRTTASLKNFSVAYLGELSKDGAYEIIPTAASRTPVMQQVEARLQLAREDEKYGFFGLIKVAKRAAAIAQLPPPNAFASRMPLSEDYPETDTPEPLPHRNVRNIIRLPEVGQSTEKTPDDEFLGLVEQAKVIEKINEIRAKGETRITSIVSQVWGVSVGTRAYRKAREEYRKLMGE